VASQKKKIPTILTAEELLNKAFHRAVKITKQGDDRLDGKKRTAHARFNASGDIITGTLDKYVRSFPSMEKREDFMMELVHLLIDMDKLKKSLGAINWASHTVKDITSEYIRQSKNSQKQDQLERIRKEYYGRVSSVIYQVQDDLKLISFARDEFRKLPTIETDVPTVVIAGYPNVGKSQLVDRISTAKPKIAAYPFTTKGITIGHFKEGWRTFQVVDTPGLLDRDFESRNDIEKQAILALKYLADLIVFVIDPSETSGYRMEQQMSLLESVKQNFSGIKIIEVENKTDLVRTDSDRMKMSALTGEGVEEVMKVINAELLLSKKGLVESQPLTNG
jgi:nucleolar GTP-binding protein